VLVAGVFAGGINTVVGSGTLVTFPVLLAIGYPPVVANVSNTVGLVPGSVSGAIGYREELTGQRPRVLRLGLASLLGGLTGAILLLTLPAAAFEAIVPALIALALVLVVLQPRLSRMVAERRTTAREHGGPLLWTGIFGTGVYGGYFGAAQGIILLAIVNGVAAVVFVAVADVAWAPALLLAAGATVGGQIGAKVGRRLSPALLRGVIVVVGVAAIVQIVL
jgi:uncharacterized membrane protein YfcA